MAKRRSASPYALISPYLSNIIIYVTANLRSSRSLLTELARFLSREPSELLAFTLSHSLPSLVSTCSRDEILIVASTVGRPAAALLIEKVSDVLKAVYLLPDDGAVDEALDFLTQMVAEAAGAKAGSVGTQALVSSCNASLLGELVIVLGDEGPKALMASI
jgi:serine/threonine-protein kinase ATR